MMKRSRKTCVAISIALKGKPKSIKARAAMSAAAKKRNRSAGYSDKHAAAISAGVARYWEKRRKLGLSQTNRTVKGHKKHGEVMRARNGHAPYKGALLRAWIKYRGRYKNQKNDARSRKILFLLSFKEWWVIWRDSGCIHKRGCHKGQYVMARGTPECPDVGSYGIGNIRIIPALQNRAELGDPCKQRRLEVNAVPF
jgi:hypothetical protein